MAAAQEGADLAGRSSLQVTMDRYGHMFLSGNHSRVVDGTAERMYAQPEPVRAQAGKRPGKAGWTLR